MSAKYGLLVSSGALSTKEDTMSRDFLKGWRTLIVNGISLAVLIIAGLTGYVENPETLRWFAIAVTILNIVMRFLTTGPVPTPGDSA